MISVAVYYKSTGKPVKGARIAVGFDGIFRGITKEQFSDSNGEVHFDVDPGTGNIYVNGKTVFKGSIQGRKLVYI